jgi:hypothetical protein
MAGWLSRNNYVPTDKIRNDMFNSLANDDRYWGGDVNGGGYRLANVILDGSGGFQYYPSPVEVTPGTDGQGVLQLDQTVSGNRIKRWTAGKDSATESGGNSGSNFAIVRYDDAGALLGIPFAINRASGLITMGAQKWTGAIDGGGQTLSNVVIPGTLADPTTTKGDLIARGAAAIGRVAVGTNGQVLAADSAQPQGVAWIAANAHTHEAAIITGRIATARLGTGTADATVYLRGDGAWAPAGGGSGGAVTSIFGRAGVVVAQTGDYTVAQVTGAMANPTTTKGDLIVRDASGPARLPVGTDGYVLIADSTQALGMRWTSGGSGSQTPWVSDIDGAGFTLKNVGKVGIATATPGFLFSMGPVVTNRKLAVYDFGGDFFGFGVSSGIFRYDSGISSDHVFYTSGGATERMRLTSDGKLGIGTVPVVPLSVITSLIDQPSLTANTGVITCWNPAGLQLSIGCNDRGSWLQTKFSNSDGRAFQLILNPLGGNIGVGVTVPGQALHVAPSGIALTSSDGQPNYYRIAPASDQTELRVAYFVSGDWYPNAAGGLHMNFSGQLGIGKSPAYPLDVVGDVNCTGAFRVNGAAISTGGITGIVVQAAGTAAGSGAPHPTINFMTGTSASPSASEDIPNNRYNVAYNFTSDVRLKQKIVDLEGGLSVIDRMRPVAFEWNGAGGFMKGRRSVAIIAQELQELLPDCVYPVRQRLRPEDEETDVLCYDPIHILFHLVLAVKQLKKQLLN